MTGGGGRRLVLLTGATGNWGRATLRQFREQADRVVVRAFAQPTDRDRAVLADFADMPNLQVCWGDLTSAADVQAAVAGVDLVLHVGAVVSPLADRRPDLARRVNEQSMAHLIDAVRAQPDPGAVGLVGVGSVAQTGNRNPPVHWGRVGDPLRVSQYDVYGQTKVVAERMLVDSGLPRWAWLRQTGILHTGIVGMRDPILTHSTLNGVMEWVTDDDAARLLVALTDAGLPADFWGGVYNVGGGEQWRLTNWQLQQLLRAAMGVRDVRRWFDRNWFATRNFHGHWFTDSDRLQELAPFRRDAVADAVARVVGAAPAGVRLAGRIPAPVIKHLALAPVTRQPRGTMRAIRSGDTEEIDAHFGSLAAWRAIGDWSTFREPQPSRAPIRLDHGYDEDKPSSSWGAEVYRGVAAFRGGRLLSRDVTTGAVATPLRWACAFGHEFDGSPRLVLTAGHWCPVCVQDSAGTALQAQRNAFLAQVLD